MTKAFHGKDLLLQILKEGTAGDFETVGGIRSNSFSMNGEMVDVTSKDSQGFREYLSGAGLRSASLSGSGVFKNDFRFQQLNRQMLDGIHETWRIIVPDLGSYTGVFAISSLSLTGEHNGEITFSISMESAGALVFDAVT